MIEIDGSIGGGQILRTALSLSLVTGRPFGMTRIRGVRPKPGLMRQHLTCVLAAQEVGDAEVTGAEIGSQDLSFAPRGLRGGDFQFAIGGGGSTTLVFQTLLPALLHAPHASTLTVEGGTHNPLAPPFEFIERCFLPVLQRMGVKASVSLQRAGFAQAGGGMLVADIQPVKKWKRLALMERGDLIEMFGEVLHAHLPDGIAKREIETAHKILKWNDGQIKIRTAGDSIGPGNIIMLGARFTNVTELCSTVAHIGRSAESVAQGAAKGLLTYLANAAPVGVHLADQLLVPLALAGAGAFMTFALSDHFHSNMALIPKFLDVQFQVKEGEGGRREVSVVKS